MEDAFIDILASRKLPDGYVIASTARYPMRLYDETSGKHYDHSVQLLNSATMDVPRGVGFTFGEALDHAIESSGSRRRSVATLSRAVRTERG